MKLLLIAASIGVASAVNCSDGVAAQFASLTSGWTPDLDCTTTCSTLVITDVAAGGWDGASAAFSSTPEWTYGTCMTSALGGGVDLAACEAVASTISETGYLTDWKSHTAIQKTVLAKGTVKPLGTTNIVFPGYESAVQTCIKDESTDLSIIGHCYADATLATAATGDGTAALDVASECDGTTETWVTLGGPSAIGAVSSWATVSACPAPSPAGEFVTSAPTGGSACAGQCVQLALRTYAAGGAGAMKYGSWCLLANASATTEATHAPAEVGYSCNKIAAWYDMETTLKGFVTIRDGKSAPNVVAAANVATTCAGGPADSGFMVGKHNAATVQCKTHATNGTNGLIVTKTAYDALTSTADADCVGMCVTITYTADDDLGTETGIADIAITGGTTQFVWEKCIAAADVTFTCADLTAHNTATENAYGTLGLIKDEKTGTANSFWARSATVACTGDATNTTTPAPASGSAALGTAAAVAAGAAAFIL